MGHLSDRHLETKWGKAKMGKYKKISSYSHGERIYIYIYTIDICRKTVTLEFLNLEIISCSFHCSLELLNAKFKSWFSFAIADVFL